MKVTKKILKAICFVVFAAAVAIAGGVYAKYVTERRQQTYLEAAKFHFTSDLLTESGSETYSVYDWTDGFDIKLYNYEQANTALVSTADIIYSVTIKKNGVTDTDFRMYIRDSGGTAHMPAEGIPGGTAQAYTLTLEPKEGAAVSSSDVYTVEVTATAPYTKTMSASFVMDGGKGCEHTLSRLDADKTGDRYVLTVKTNAEHGTLSVALPAGLVPDGLGELTSDWTGAGGSDAVSSFATYTLIFFNPDGLDYDIDDFTVTVD